MGSFEELEGEYRGREAPFVDWKPTVSIDSAATREALATVEIQLYIQASQPAQGSIV